MPDQLTKQHRSWNMSRIGGKNTSPEKRVRSELHRMGYRFRIHRKNLPGHPDIVFVSHRIAVFVHGCFWHRHRGCKNCTTPTNNQEFWVTKLEGNAVRDKKNQHALRKLGWRTIILWECEIEKAPKFEQALSQLTKLLNARR
jgi:DNA mismatch endonuclease (patch repair protein)